MVRFRQSRVERRVNLGLAGAGDGDGDGDGDGEFFDDDEVCFFLSFCFSWGGRDGMGRGRGGCYSFLEYIEVLEFSSFLEFLIFSLKRETPSPLPRWLSKISNLQSSKNPI